MAPDPEDRLVQVSLLLTFCGDDVLATFESTLAKLAFMAPLGGGSDVDIPDFVAAILEGFSFPPEDWTRCAAELACADECPTIAMFAPSSSLLIKVS